MGKNRCESTKMSEIWEKMGNPMPFETQPTQHEKLWGPATHSPKYEAHIILNPY